LKFQIATLALAAAFVAAALATGEHRAGALVGAVVSSTISIAETFAMGFSARRAAKPTQAAFLVFTVAFLFRLVAVGVSLYAVHVAGWSTVAFVIAFFVPFFVLSAVEWGYLHSLRRLPGTPA
jgi:hypothetical protein